MEKIKTLAKNLRTRRDDLMQECRTYHKHELRHEEAAIKVKIDLVNEILYPLEECIHNPNYSPDNDHFQSI